MAAGDCATRFWDIVDVPPLLARLALDGPKMGKRLTALLVNSFFPSGKSVDMLVRSPGPPAALPRISSSQLNQCATSMRGRGGQAKRATALWTMNPAAARPFFFYLPRYAPLEAGPFAPRPPAPESVCPTAHPQPCCPIPAVIHFWEHVYTTAHAALVAGTAPAVGAVSPATWLETAALLWESCHDALAKDKKLNKVRRPSNESPWVGCADPVDMRA